MSGFKRYDEEFKQFLVNLYQTGKTQTELCKDYGISHSALARWIKQYPQVKLDDDTVAVFMQNSNSSMRYRLCVAFDRLIALLTMLI